MKMIYAGQDGSTKTFDQLLFNCTRNQKCQKPFYVPVNQFSDIVLYADLPGVPEDMTFEVMNVCEIGNVGSFVPFDYVIGQRDDLGYYGVFGGFIVTPPVGVTYQRFFFKITVTIGVNVYTWFSEQYEFPVCETLTELKGCYPNEREGVAAYDCNGLYYGYPTVDETQLGNPNYKYIHKGFVRMGEIIEQRNRMQFTAFNSQRIFRNEFTREWLFEFELVPTFYKDHLIAIFNRGNVQVDGTEWKLADTQDISMIDTDSKLWRMDMTFDKLCKQVFGCAPADCEFRIPEVDPCCDPSDISAISEPVAPCEAGCGRYRATAGPDSAATFMWVDCAGDNQITGIAATEEFLFCTCDEHPLYSTENVTVVRVSDCVD